MTDLEYQPDLILTNGVIYTLDSSRPVVDSVAVTGRKVTAAGSGREIRGEARSGTEVLDLQGRAVIPGMMDSHFHFYDWSIGRRQLDLSGVRSFEEISGLVRQEAGKQEPGSWIVGFGWNESDWPVHRKPLRDDLDAAAPANPVALWRCDLHLVSVNSPALDAAGIVPSTPDPPEGVIEKDASGRPTGILRELAANLVKTAIPAPEGETLYGIMREGIVELNSLGLTSLHDMRLMGGLEGADALRMWQVLRERGELNLRCWVGIAGEHIEEAIKLGLRTGLGDDRLRIGPLKFFADGGMGARTGWLIEPYLDAEYGMPLAPMAHLSHAYRQAEQAGMAVVVHAIGDRANRELVDLLQELDQWPERRGNFIPPAISHRIEHAQMIRPDDVLRLAALGIPVCMQPHNMILDINMIDESVGDRGRFTYPFKEMLDAGVLVLFGSDAPVCAANPFVNIHAAVTRRRADGTPAGGWYPRQCLSVEEALRCYTVSPAEYYRRENVLGTITPGKFADIVVLDRDIFTVDPMDIIDTKVEMTIFDGRIVYRRGKV
ncbi:MAG TPA: amidohydrolase [Desulfobacteraceae bacterium]|nr:amidohydrolase [Desulfobacteraceae bacterium]